MNTPPARKGALHDPRINVRIKLSALWASVMFCYVYGDYFGLYVPGKIAEMSAGNLGPLGPATTGVLVGVAAMMAIPSLMVFLSLSLAPVLSRWSNMVLGVAYTGIMLMTLSGAWSYYKFLGIIEVLLTLLVVWTAWRWPRQGDHAE